MRDWLPTTNVHSIEVMRKDGLRCAICKNVGLADVDRRPAGARIWLNRG